jgi:hypothetical protein
MIRVRISIWRTRASRALISFNSYAPKQEDPDEKTLHRARKEHIDDRKHTDIKSTIPQPPTARPLLPNHPHSPYLPGSDLPHRHPKSPRP